MKRFSFLMAAFALIGCATTPSAPVIAESDARDSTCQTPYVTLDARFPAAGMAACQVINPTTISVSIRPEDEDINPSPWYAVRISADPEIAPTIILDYEGFKHRYAPKVSQDGKTWTRLSPARLTPIEGTDDVILTLPPTTGSYFLAGQELFDNAAYDIWIDGLAKAANVRVETIGASIEGRPIRMLTSEAVAADPAGRKTVMLVGRQHPPEVTGALAMRHFVDTILGESELAQRFRQRFDIVIAPNMNPDGVELGHWRHNLGGLDLNRDWGPFSQPETQALKTVIDRIADDPANRFVLFLDFHSTQRNVFYTQTQEDEPTPYDFTGQWMARAALRLPEYDFERAERHNTDLPTSKNYMHARFDIPAITYELGDETDRAQIALSGRVFAEEMMTLLLEHE